MSLVGLFIKCRAHDVLRSTFLVLDRDLRNHVIRFCPAALVDFIEMLTRYFRWIGHGIIRKEPVIVSKASSHLVKGLKGLFSQSDLMLRQLLRSLRAFLRFHKV